MRKKPLRIAFIADLHYYPADLTGNYCTAFREDNRDLGKPAEQSQGVLLSALAALRARAARGGLDYLILAGDLTRDGEYEAHAHLARLLEQFRRDSGVRVAVIPGNHDLNNPDAAEYRSGAKRTARKTSPMEFLMLYGSLVLPGARRYPGTCGFAADLGDDFRLIAMDTCKYDLNGNIMVSGEISHPQMRWILGECEAAKKAGKAVLGTMHHNLCEHVGYQDALFKGYLLDDYIAVRETLADAGMRYCFTGHVHAGGAAQAVSDDGDLLYDICVPALSPFPSELLLAQLQRSGKKVTARLETFPADEALPVTAAGRTYQQPYYKENFQLTLGGSRGGGFTGFLQANIRLRLPPMLQKIRDTGGLKAYFNIDANSFLTAVLAQLDQRYVNEPRHTAELVCRILEDGMNRQISDLPCTMHLDSLGLGHRSRPGTVRDFLETALAVIYWRGSLEDDPFLRDVLRRLGNGWFVDEALRFFIDKVVDDLLLKELAPALKLRLGSKSARSVKRALRAALGMAVDLKRRRAISRTLAWLAREFLGRPDLRDTALVHKGRGRAPASEHDFRRPMELQIKRNGANVKVTWYTKESITASDVIVCGADMHPIRGLRMHGGSAREPYTARKLDVGFAKIAGYEIAAAKHSVTVAGLAPGSYVLLAGDAARSWMSPGVSLNTGAKTRAGRALGYAKATAATAFRVFYSFRLVKKA